MNPKLRRLFDSALEEVLAQLPPPVHDLLEDIPLVIDDHPSAELMRRLGLRDRSSLCGLYTGVPLTERSVSQSGIPSDVVHLFREGILDMASDARGTLDEVELREQIRLTILHELGHHHGLDEEELRELGY